MSYSIEGDRIGTELVHAPCTNDSPHGGYWFCSPHGPLPHNLAAQQHMADGCQLAWYCFTCNQLESALHPRYRAMTDRADVVVCGDCSSRATVVTIPNDELQQHDGWHDSHGH